MLNYFTNKIFITKDNFAIFVVRNRFKSFWSMEETIDRILRKYPAGKKDSLIPLLQEIQRESGIFQTAPLLKSAGI